MVGKSDFALYSSLNFCEDNVFFRYKKTNEKTLIKNAIFGVDFSFFNEICEICCMAHLLLNLPLYRSLFLQDWTRSDLY